ncbi:unnamed protein product [marine sediment metagenome]|uniref:Uncharacterized protein n=1 Tax=marine sediment metagenome TaxID=412755 RepID=X1GQ78_9ZZZZ
MLAAIFVIGLVVGIALLVLGRIRDGEEFWGGFVLTCIFSICMLVWIGYYATSCTTVGDLETFWKVEKHNYEDIIKSYGRGVDWPSEGIKVYDLVGMAKVFSDFTEKIEHYNQELGRLRGFNNNVWLDPIFKDVPEELDYILLD